ncbi:MAG: hypothetical protein V1784_09700 [bacterium]
MITNWNTTTGGTISPTNLALHGGFIVHSRPTTLRSPNERRDKMGLRVRNAATFVEREVVCAAEYPPENGDFYIPDDVHSALVAHFVSRITTSEPGLCWHCKANPAMRCMRCEALGLKAVAEREKAPHA